MIIMLLGVIIFTYASGSLSSILSHVDSNTAFYQTKLNVLMKMREDYKIEDTLFNDLNNHIKE